jgi:hypothetical protein
MDRYNTTEGTSWISCENCPGEAWAIVVPTTTSRGYFRCPDCGCGGDEYGTDFRRLIPGYVSLRAYLTSPYRIVTKGDRDLEFLPFLDDAPGEYMTWGDPETAYVNPGLPRTRRMQPHLPYDR